ncbi:MAG: ABC transporter permease subunit, partial [Candidatus Dormiibacterota bacterium]
MVHDEHRLELTAAAGDHGSTARADRRRGGVGHLRAASLPASLLQAVFWLLLSALLLIPILLFLIAAFSPALFGQGASWLTVAPFVEALQGPTLQGLADSLVVGIVSAGGAVAMALILAWLTQRTNLFGRRLWTVLVWVLLLAPSFLTSLGWERLLEPDGLLSQLGVQDQGLRTLFFGPLGVIVLLAIKGIPFAYLAVSAALGAVGREFEDAVRVHGGGRRQALTVVLRLLMPAIWSGFAIVFAEAISDFGVASTIAATARFPVATTTLYDAVDNFPANFPVAAVVGWLLVAAAGLALLGQALALRNRSYQVLSGRTRPGARTQLSRTAQATWIAIVGAVSASLQSGSGKVVRLSASNYTNLLAHPGPLGPLQLSGGLAAVAATLSIVVSAAIARALTARRGGVLARALDWTLLAAVGLPGIVLGAGYIFAYNLPFWQAVGLPLYGTLFLLGMAYVANSLPSATRLLVGPMAQFQRTLQDAARVHGIGAARAWLSIVLPLLSRSLLWAWIFGFTGIVFELPLSQLLYPSNQEPLSVAITHALATYD